MVASALVLLGNAWAAFSPAAALVGLSGVGLVLAAIAGLTVLPAGLRRPVLGLGLVLIVLAAVWQAGEAKGAHDAFALTSARTLAAEIKRADAAERALAADRRRAAADAATIADLRRQIDETPDDPRACLDRAAAGRVRRIR